jgi:NAD(P)-dependent dehydrogenase (short-subunit alcohol dehydrogenase family)
LNITLGGKRILVTGGNSGLGAAIARAFAEAGASVAINHLDNHGSTDAVLASFPNDAASSLALQADVSSADGVNAMFRELDEVFGGIDVLVNNAGMDGARSKAWESDVADWSRVLDVNLRGAFLCAREALARMTAQRSGVVINISSVHEIIPWSGYSAYAASKAGLSMMAKTMAQEAAPFGVRVLCVAPGAIATPINANVRNDPDAKRDLLEKIPMGRIGRPEEIANMCVVLASDVASYVTGATMFIDGGMSNYPEFAHGG